MRLSPFPHGVHSVPPPPGGTATPAPDRHAVVGAWSATRWEYTRLAGLGRRDVVCDLDATITLSLSENTWILAAAVPGDEPLTLGGRYATRGELLELIAPEGGVEQVIWFRVSGELLSLRSDAIWAFGDDGEHEPASLIAVFVRL